MLNKQGWRQLSFDFTWDKDDGNLIGAWALLRDLSQSGAIWKILYQEIAVQKDFSQKAIVLPENVPQNWNPFIQQFLCIKSFIWPLILPNPSEKQRPNRIWNYAAYYNKFNLSHHHHQWQSN